MVKHIVCFKLKDGSPESCEKARDVLLSMRGKVEDLQDIHVGVDFLRSPRSYDLILEVTLASRKILDSYQNDPYHVDTVKAYMHQVQESSVSIDYEI